MRSGTTLGSGTMVADTAYIYDVQGRMTQASVAEDGTTTTVTYKYDHNGFRVERREGTGPTTMFHVDPANATGYAQVLEQGGDDDGDRKLDAFEVDLAFTIGMRVLSHASSATASERLLADAHGSTRAVLDAAATLTAAAVLQRLAYTAVGPGFAWYGPDPAAAPSLSSMPHRRKE